MEYEKLIKTSLDYIEDHLEETLTLEKIAGIFNVSKYYYHRLFTAIIGETLNNYIISRKLNKSLELMKDSNLSLTDIAYRLEFGNQSSFNRSFKKRYHKTPNQIRNAIESFSVQPVPEIVSRPIKNLNGDIITDFTLVDFEKIRLKGIVFQVDLANEDFKERIRNKAQLLLNALQLPEKTRSYMVYSSCSPNSTKFNALFGIETDNNVDLENFFEVKIPKTFCAKFRYNGDLLDISEVFTSDFSRFLNVSKLEAAEHDIELIQSFITLDEIGSSFEVFVPIKKISTDFDI